MDSKDFDQLTIASTDSAGFVRHHNGVAINLKRLDDLFMNIPGIGPVTFQRKKPKTVGIITSAGQHNYAVFPKNTFYDSVSVGMSVKRFKADSIRVDILPEAYPLQKDYKFYIHKDSSLTDTAKLSFYQWDRKHEKWEVIPTHFTDDQMIGEAESLGKFISLRDTTAPLLSNPRLSKRPDGQWLVMVDVTDDFSGINYHKTKMWVNGKQGIAEYEPEDDRFVYYLPGWQPSSSMDISVIAYDKMGNKREKHFHLGNRSDKAKK